MIRREHAGTLNRKRGKRGRTRSANSLIAAFTLLLLAVVGGGGAANAATSGSITESSITTLFDGAVVPNELDNSGSNNTVAVADKVGFKWTITAEDLVEGKLSQTIPACWSWDVGTLGSVNQTNAYYSSSYVITDNADGSHTLTATVTTNQSGTVGIDFRTLTATVGKGCPDGSSYTPELRVTDAQGTVTRNDEAITVRSETRSDLVKVLGGNGAGTHDFGAGAVSARYVDYAITIQQPVAGAPGIGAAPTTLALPISFTDDYVANAPGVTTDMQIVSQSLPAGDNAVLAGDTITISGPVDLDLNAASARVVVRIWVPDDDVPNFGDPALTLRNTVTPVGDWGVGNNDAVTTNNTATGVYQKPRTSPTVGAAAARKTIWVARDPENPVFRVDPAHSQYQEVSGAAVAPNAVLMDRLYAHNTTTNGAHDGATNLVAYNFWDPTKQRLISDQGYYVGDGLDNALPASDYTVQYTSGTNAAAPASNTWVNSVAAAGGINNVSGIRFVYTGAPVYAQGATGGDMWFLVGVPYRVVAPAGDVAEDTARWTSDEGNANYTNHVTVQPYSLGLAKSSDRSSYAAGDQIAYTINTFISPAPGGRGPVTASPYVVVDTLPASILAVDTRGVDPAWRVNERREGDHIVLTFTHVGPVTSEQPVQPISFLAQTSLEEPPGAALTNRAELFANEVAGPRAAVTVTVRQADVVAKQKVSTVGPDIEVGDPEVSWKSTWVNYQDVTQGRSTFVDVLPYNGDGRGTAFHGTAKLSSAVLDGAAATTGTLFYSTDAPGTIADAPAASTTWIPAAGVNLAAVDGVTALKVELSDFASGNAGVGGLSVTMAVQGQRIGDVYANTITGKTNGFTFGHGKPAEVEVVGSSVTGIVWNDADKSATNNGETGLAGVTVNLLNENGDVVATTTTDADGKYVFDDVRSGSYRVQVARGTVATALAGGALQTYDLQAPLDDDSGVLVVPFNDRVADVDFGYRKANAALTLVKKTNGKHYDNARGAELEVGDAVTWTYEVRNTGELLIRDLTVADEGSDGSVPEVSCPTPAGGLEPDASVTCTASGTAIAGQYSNTAVASGRPVDSAGNAVVGLALVASNADSSYYFGTAKPEPTPTPTPTPTDGPTDGPTDPGPTDPTGTAAPDPGPSSQPKSSYLPSTGGPAWWLLIGSLGALVAGASVLIGSRRRSERH